MVATGTAAGKPVSNHFEQIPGEILYHVTEESLMDRLDTNMQEACLQIDKDCKVLTVHGSDDSVVQVEEALGFA
ncbi:alpha/beta-Hydrolases superfamily protein [Artemisia annua]|uniref:Alpha/beta-Hydrolases superfamily protein n=1 Tax=Artemisia annua TaxID=35608 RepID=A0A2U1NG23_ARTAN|nr:alpha/beta-Hydrolases superfamily protein [Artemisia annua]